MKKHENQKSDRKWVIKAMIAFLAVLAILTFFSNTIMNLTIPLVVTSYAMRGNLAYTNSATAPLVSDDKYEVKGLDGRTVSTVEASNYDLVSEGDVIVTLEPVEDMHELTDLENQLLTLQRQQEYAARTPSHTDFTTQNQAVRTAERALAEAQATLNSATTRDDTIAAAQQVLNANQAAVVALQAQVASASASVESINATLAALYARLAVLDGTQTAVLPIPTNAPGMYAPRADVPGKYDPTDPGDPDSTTIAPDPAAAAAGDPASNPTDATTTTAAPTTPSSSDTAPTTTQSIPAATVNPDEGRDAIIAQIAQYQGQLTEAQNRLTGYSSQLAAAQIAVANAQTAITTAQALPSSYAAADAVADAQAALTAAQVALSDAQINAGIAADQAADAVEDRERQIADLEDKIARARARLECNEIVAPADGYIINMAVSEGDKITGEPIIFVIVPEGSSFSASFTFPTNVAQSLSVGQELSSNDYYWIDRIVITNIKPDPANPRDNRIVKCAIYSDSQLWPGESITVTADRGNSTYDHVVAASAISEDNSGYFVYVLNKTSSPLGDRYTVRRVAVQVVARSGAFAAITGDGLDNAMVVTRSEVPLHNGDRVRLEDYSESQS